MYRMHKKLCEGIDDPMIALSNIAQGSAVFAYYIMHRHDEREAQISLPATISAYLGYRTSPLRG